MIPWNILRKVKPIRLCFLDNRVGTNYNFTPLTSNLKYCLRTSPPLRVIIFLQKPVVIFSQIYNLYKEGKYSIILCLTHIGRD